ncbi:MAG: CRISPR-associated endonuclease Cas2 [Kiritimatiellae bacterium]|nr:CRISPR-associated endonuclease Cas2 [Kiritimatiellia bacterium]
MFDLPVKTTKNRRDYRIFRKFLLQHGFAPLEESVYCRMIPSGNPLRTLQALIRKNKPPEGIVAILVVTERQFENMEFITGEWKHNIIDSTEDVIEL